MKSTSKAHANGRFAKKYYVSRRKMPEMRHFSSRLEIPQSGIMEVRLKNQRFFNQKFVLAPKFSGCSKNGD